ncbi:unnamed protein product, partial [marine sediment metagenome]
KKQDKLKRESSAGGVVFKRIKNQESRIKTKAELAKVLWMVTKSRPSELFPKPVWRLPKGWLDDKDGEKKPGLLASGQRKATEEELQKAAIREVKEEGGIEAKIVSKIGTERYFFTLKKKKILKFVTFYLMEWLKDLPQGAGFETEKVEWLLYKEARKKLSYSGEKKVLDKAREILSSGVQESLV